MKALLSFFSLQFCMRFYQALEYVPSISVGKTHIRSTTSVKLLARTEIEFLERLNESLPRLEPTTKTLALEYLRIYTENTKSLRGYSKAQSLTQRANAIASNSFSIYQHVHRWLNHLAPLVVLLQESADILEPLEGVKGYTEMDLNATMTDILKIIHVFNYDLPMAVKGTLRDLSLGTELSTEQCLELARFARVKKFYALSIQSYEETLVRVGEHVRREGIELLLNGTIKEHDDLVRQKGLHPLKKQFLFDRKIKPLIKRHGREKQKQMRTYQRVKIPWISLRDIPFVEDARSLGLPHAHDICLYKGLQTDEEKRSLFCWYESTLHPYFTINPLKMELLSEKPEIVQIYEVISLEKRKAFINVYVNRTNLAAISYLHVRNHVESVVGNKDVFPVPIEPMLLSAFQPWDSQDEGVGDYQVHAQAPGSKFHVHYNLPAPFSPPENGNTVSILHYVEEPELGGETIFLHPRIAVKPIAGSSIIFINQLNEGAVDFEMTHATCPVLFGTKHVVLKNIKLYTWNPQCTKFTFGKLKHYPKSKILSKKLYPKLTKYLENEEQAGLQESHIIGHH